MRYSSTTPAADIGRMLQHLLAVCSECREAGGTILAAYEAGGDRGACPGDDPIFEAEEIHRDALAVLEIFRGRCWRGK